MYKIGRAFSALRSFFMGDLGLTPQAIIERAFGPPWNDVPSNIAGEKKREESLTNRASARFPRSAIRDPRSAIRDPRSAIRDQDYILLFS